MCALTQEVISKWEDKISLRQKKAVFTVTELLVRTQRREIEQQSFSSLQVPVRLSPWLPEQETIDVENWKYSQVVVTVYRESARRTTRAKKQREKIKTKEKIGNA